MKGNTNTRVRINGNIKALEVRLVDENKQMLGIVSTAEALEIARSKRLDLIEVSPNASPPVCKILDFGKFRYETQKRLQDAKKKQKTVETKEIKVRPTIADGDYKIKLRNIKRFLEEKHKVRIVLIFKGREVTHKDVGFVIMEKFKQDLEMDARIDLGPKSEGRQIFMMLSPAQTP
jgi:translation initiation factor IF-3